MSKDLNFGVNTHYNTVYRIVFTEQHLAHLPLLALQRLMAFAVLKNQSRTETGVHSCFAPASAEKLLSLGRNVALVCGAIYCLSELGTYES